jgi:outer membrane cobalamin receptor
MKPRAASLAAAVALLLLVPRLSSPQEEAEKEPDPQSVNREEVVVVTASRNETSLVDAPAAMSVVTAEQIARSPAAGYADVLRTLPGLNVIEMAPGQIDVTSRLATGVASRTQLTLVDGRLLSLDFVGVTPWGFAPLDIDDAKRIELVQGPASAVWGANALPSGTVRGARPALPCLRQFPEWREQPQPAHPRRPGRPAASRLQDQHPRSPGPRPGPWPTATWFL